MTPGYFIRLIGTTLCLILLTPSALHAVEWRAPIRNGAEAADPKVPEQILWKNAEARVQHHKGQFWATLIGQVSSNHWNVIWKKEDNLHKVPIRTKQGHFYFRLPLNEARTSLEFIVIDPRGRTQTEQWLIDATGAWPRMVEWKNELTNPKRYSAATGLGMTHLNYQETGLEGASGFTMTGKLSFSHKIGLLGPGWDAGFLFFGNLLGVQEKSTGDSIRFIGANSRIGYSLPLQSRWSLALHGGWYLTTTWIPTKSFGFTNMHGPQFFPTASYQLANNHSIGGYFKFSPVSATGIGSITNFANREIAVGFSYSLPWNGPSQRIGLGLDIAMLQLDLPESGLRFSSTSYSLGATYQF